MGKRREGDSGRNDIRRDSTAMAGASAPAAGAQDSSPAFSGPEPARIAGAEADNFVLAPSTTPVVLSPAEASVYALLLESRSGPMPSAMIIRTIRDQVQPKSPHSLMFRLEHVHECLRLVGGKAMSRVDPAMRQVVHRPYCARGSQKVIVPTMCSLHPEAVSPQAPAPVVAAPAPSTIRLRTREELRSELNELDSRIDERLAALKLARLVDLDLSLIGLRVREEEAKGTLRFIGEQLEETKRLIAELNDPAVDDRKKFEVPKMLLDLLARAGLLRSAIEKYAIVEEVAGVLFETN